MPLVLPALTCICLLLSYIVCYMDPDPKAVELFERYKDLYHRVYGNADAEKKALFNFVNNVETVIALNTHVRNGEPANVLNKYADLDPAAVEEHLAIHLKPYDHGLNNNTQKERENRKFIEEMHLYDLFDAENLYNEWMKKFGKQTPTKKLERHIHYYRFIKSLVEYNRKRFAGQDVTLGPDADVVKEPDEYFYG